MSVTVREATPDDRLGVRRVLDAAMLEVRDDLEERIEAGDVLVAEAGDGPVAEASDDRPILGALVLVPHGCAGDIARDSEPGDRAQGAHVHAVAVRRARRGCGIGSALVRAAIERQPRLTAEFEPSLRGFYESLSFEIEAADDGRLRGRYESEPDG